MLKCNFKEKITNIISLIADLNKHKLAVKLN